MTQFMKLFLAGTITGMLMTTAAIGTAAAAGPENRITILYDAFGNDASMRKDWGFSALVEIVGKRILFDTGDRGGRQQAAFDPGSRVEQGACCQRGKPRGERLSCNAR